MRKLIAFLSSLALITSNSSIIMACQREVIYNDCFDEEWNNVTDKGSDNKQWLDIAYIRIFFFYLNNKIFPDSSSFYQINNKTSDELTRNYLKDPEGQPIEEDLFNNNFTFLITNYGSIDNSVIAAMKANQLADKESGTYLFLNFPEIDITNIKNESNIDFQFIFIIKDSEGAIKNNTNNNWFYWHDWKTTNISPDEYFFNLEIGTSYQRVVTKYLN